MKRAHSASHVHETISTKQLSMETWPDFDELFSAHGGVWGGCWCMFYHLSGGFNSGDYSGNKGAKKSLVRHNKAHGTIVYCGDVPVGWCQFGPSGELPRIDRKRGYEPSAADPWRITCMFVDKRHRRMGISARAVSASIDAMKKLGVREIEAYPVTGRLSASLLWSGTPSLFESQGFKRLRPLGKSGWIYALSLR